MSPPNKNKCCICSNTRPDYTLHSFPSRKYKDIYDKWIDAIGRKEIAELPIDVVRKKYHVCEAHFGRNDYYISQQVRKLKKNSIPTIDGKKVDSPCTPRKDRRPTGITCTPQTVKYFAKSLEEKLLAEFYTKKEEMGEAQYVTNVEDMKEAPCIIKVEKTENAQYFNNTEEMEEGPCITNTEEMEGVQYIIKREETEESQYITDDDFGTSWANREDTVHIEVVPDIFEFR